MLTYAKEESFDPTQWNLSIRSERGLKKAGVITWGQLRKLMEKPNTELYEYELGERSIKEIREMIDNPEAWINATTPVPQ